MISVPSPATLAKYGLSEAEWRSIGERQGWVCAICKKEPTNGRLCIDHEHAKGWKKMPPEQRKLYVRGLLDWFCNHYYVGRGITIPKAQNVVTYLSNYEEAKAATQRPGSK
jgi:hypothetical protein